MKVTHTVLEGTPEELQKLDQWPLIVGTISQVTTPTDDPQGDAEPANSSALPSELDNFIAKRGVSNSGRNLIRQLTEHFLLSGEATWKIGTSKSSPDGQTPYFSLYALGPQRVGAAAYIHPVNGRVTVRLTWDDADVPDELRAHAFKASEQEGNMYAIGVMVTSQSTYDAATRLIGIAIEHARQA